DHPSPREGPGVGRSHPDRSLLQERTRADVRGADPPKGPDVHGQSAGPPVHRGTERRTADGPDAARSADDVQGRVRATRFADLGSSSMTSAGFPISQMRSDISDIASPIAGSFVQIAMSSPRYDESSSGIGWLMRNSLPSTLCMYTGIWKSMWRTSACFRSMRTSSRFSGVKQNAYLRRTPWAAFSTRFGRKRRLRQDLHEPFLVQLLHRRVYPRPRDLRQGGDLACRRGAEIEERQVHPGLVFRQAVLHQLPDPLLVDRHETLRRRGAR